MPRIASTERLKARRDKMDDAGVGCEMPRYKCHKEVWALKIAKIEFHRDGSPDYRKTGATITPADDGYGTFEVDATYLAKHAPMPGGYYVVYDDGHKSFSPAKAFEDGYSRIR